jgi:hypothetical protein
MSSAVLGNASDFKLPDPNACVRPIDVRVKASARPQNEHGISRVERPDTGKRRIHVPHEQLASSGED